MCDPNTRRSGRGAMTLVELLVVIVILGIAASMVIPAMGSTGVLKVQGALRTIVSDITFAQADAIAMQQGRAVMFDTTNNEYRLVQVVGGTVNTANTLYDPSKNNDAYVVSLGASDFGGAVISAAAFDSGANLIFDDMGMPVVSATSNTPSTGGKITVTSPDSVYDIVVDGYTGRITVRRVSGG